MPMLLSTPWADRGTGVFTAGDARRAKYIALAFGGFQAVVAAAILALRPSSEARLEGLVSVLATLWGAAVISTAVILYGRFIASRSLGALILAGGYSYAACISIPYLTSLPGVIFNSSQFASASQVRGELWIAWHTIFALTVALAFCIDPHFVRRLSASRSMDRYVVIALMTAILVAGVATSTAWMLRTTISPLVVSGHPTQLYILAAPAVSLLNACACAIVLLRGRMRTSICSWVALGLFADSLNALLNDVSMHIYSFIWYSAKLVGASGAIVVAAMFAFEAVMWYRRLVDLTMRDPLTGLQNRRGLDLHLRRTFERFREQRASLALMIVDIDHFKRYNDRYGHALGDVALSRVGLILQDISRQRKDLVARYGGEEFVIALFDVPQPEIARRGEQVRERVERECIAHEAVEQGCVTVSIGISWTAHASEPALELLFQNADRALYEAKELGRNRCVFDIIESSQSHLVPGSHA